MIHWEMVEPKLALGGIFTEEYIKERNLKKKYVVSKTETTNVTHCLT